MLSDNVINLDEHRPHLTIPTDDGNVHVVPIAFFLAVIHGKRLITELEEGWEAITRKIVLEWCCNNLGIPVGPLDSSGNPIDPVPE